MASTAAQACQPLVSVVIPVYNSERYVAATLESVIAQSHRNLEIIIVIDGSTDRSHEICQQFRDKRIRYVVQENRGLAAARNAGMHEAKGEYIGFIDSDDTWHVEKVARHLLHFASDPDLGVSFSYSALMDDQGRALGTYQKEGRDPSFFSDFYTRNVMGNGSNALIRREVFIGRKPGEMAFPAMEGFLTELKRAEDYELWSRIASLTRWKMACVKKPLVNYRINPGGLSSNIDLQRKYHFLAMARIAAYAPDQAEKWRCLAVAHAYWPQARTAASQYAPRIGTTAVKLAFWYDWRSINANHVMICLALLASLVFPEKTYYALQRRAGKVWGKFQVLQMKRDRGSGACASEGESPVPASAQVKKPSAYVRKKAMPNLFFLCHKHRFMYLGISKNASTSLKQHMWWEENEGRLEDQPGAIHRYWGWKPVRGRTIDREDSQQLALYPDYVKFAVYRDPVSRFLSAYHNRLLFPDFAHPFFAGKRLAGMGLDQFIRVTESVLKIENHLHIDEHLRPQAWCYEPVDVDFIVPIEQLDAFLLNQFGIVRRAKTNQTVLPRIPVTEQQRRKIAELYRVDYAIHPNWPPCPESASSE
ncbi:MAG: glycosyltransferase [Xanthomonadales bacterium]|jgi:glycosyltransferase involved in cell wall biosynthesis|nr:glycosyltransferase [Xanthomonadales bacterium]